MGTEMIGRNALVYGDEPLTWDFCSLPSFLYFYNKTRKVLMDTIENNTYNSAIQIVQFYKDFKNQDKNFEEFFDDYQEERNIGMDCVSMAAKLKGNFSTRLSATFPFIEDHLFFCSGDMYKIKEIPERFRNEIPEGTGQLKRHMAVAMKFTIESSRRGYFVFEASYFMGNPLVTMEDQVSPHTGRFYHNGKYHHWHLQEDSRYVKWCTTKEPNTDEELIFRWIFLGRKFIGLDELQKRNKVSYCHGIVARKGGLCGGVYKFLYEDDIFRFLYVEHITDTQPTTTKITGEQLMKEELDEDTETTVLKTAALLGIASMELKALLAQWARVFFDKEFVKEWKRVDSKIVSFIDQSIEEEIK